MCCLSIGKGAQSVNPNRLGRIGCGEQTHNLAHRADAVLRSAQFGVGAPFWVGLQMRIMGLLLAFGMFFAQIARAETAWIQLEALPDLNAAETRAREYASIGGELAGFSAGGKWYVLAIGPFDPAQAAGRMTELKQSGKIPADAYITDGAAHGQQFWPIGAAAQIAPDESVAELPAADEIAPTDAADQPVPELLVADETPEQARASEGDLPREDKAMLQTALAWYGFYDAAVDGSFGKGTRASMAAWQTANGFEPTGILTTAQRDTLTGNYAADQSQFGFQLITEPEAGIEISLPTAMITFDHYEPPFVHYTEKDGSGLRMILISEPGDETTLAGLYEVLQTLDVMPASGERSLDGNSFSLNGSNDSIASYAYAKASKGAVKGYLVTWPPALSDKMQRILLTLQSTFRSVGEKALDPGLVSLDASVRTGLLAGMAVKVPTQTGSGFFVDDQARVVTAAQTVAACARITLDGETEAQIIATDGALALLEPAAPMAPLAIASIAAASAREGSPIVAAGYALNIPLPGPVLSTGSFEQADANSITLAIAQTNTGGPALDAFGAVQGMILPPQDGQTLPNGIAVAVGIGPLAQLLADNGITGAAAPTTALSPDALAALAKGMTVQVACWP